MENAVNAETNRFCLVDLPNPEQLRDKLLYEQELKRLKKGNHLQLRLAELDKEKAIDRIYVMGCGRSGTWLLTAIISTFRDVCLIPREMEVENFGIYRTQAPTLVLKRYYTSFEKIERIPAEIKIAYIVRHPYDVLTSHNPNTKRRYHISPHRWLGEMMALQYLVDTGRPDTKIIRYEDLVMNAETVQEELAGYFHLENSASPKDIVSTFHAPPEAVAAMHGLRPIDTNSINKYKRDGEKIDYLKKIRPRLGRMLDWIAHEYRYDIAL